MKKIQIHTSKGVFHAQLDRSNQNMQLNVLHSPLGQGFFLVFKRTKTEKIVEAAKLLIEKHTSLPANTDISHLVEGCLVAGTAPAMNINQGVTFGVPTVVRAEV